jgi:hypothetical protein
MAEAEAEAQLLRKNVFPAHLSVTRGVTDVPNHIPH